MEKDRAHAESEYYKQLMEGCTGSFKYYPLELCMMTDNHTTSCAMRLKKVYRAP